MSAPTEDDASLFRAGEVVDGKYKIVRVLGRGGMGVVYEAHHELLAQPVALKVVLPEIANNHEVLSRFMNEARNSAKIASDHVARVMDVGRLENGVPFMVMELLTGQDFDALLATEQMLPPTRIADLMLEALDGIASAHALGIVHRDLKPGNLFLEQRVGRAPRVKVLDFGISKALGAQPFRGAHVTSTSSIVGSPAYMSPEQLRNSKQVDGRADIWSLGVILYQLATGVLPYNSDSVGGLFADILETVPVAPRERQPSIPEALEQVILKCLQKRPEDRYPTALALASALAPLGTTTAARALESIAALTQSSMPAIAAAPMSAPSISSASPASNPRVPSAPLSVPEAFADTHISDPHLEAQVKVQIGATAPMSIARTDGSWANEANAGSLRSAPPKKSSPIPFVLGGVVLVAIVGGVIAFRALHTNANGVAIATPQTATSVATPAPPPSPSSTPSSPLTPLTATSVAVVTAPLDTPPLTTSSASAAASNSATSAASSRPGKSGKSANTNSATPGNSASSDDSFRRF